MQAAAHNPKFSKEADIPQEVAKEFTEADKKKPRHERMYGKK